MMSLKEYALTHNYFVAAHRGSSGTAPENTMAAFREAIEAGANMIETDIHLTSDGHIVAFHDLKLLKKSNGDKNIGEFTLENLQKIDAGGWFDNKFAGERIPLLSDILSLIKDKIYLLIEIKLQKSGGNTILISRLLNMLRENQITNQVLLASFQYKLLNEIKKQSPEIPVGAIKIPFDFRSPSKIQKETGCDVFICAVNELNDKMVNDATENNIFIGTYSVDSEQDLKTALKYNVKAIGTNYPARIIEMLKSMK
jgi:glycerophosphoryl diester phosphodiesterase